jgi:hypothetical protein
MNGRAVFTFAATQVPASVKRVLEKAQVGMADLDQVFLHQGSRYIVDTLAKRIGAEGKTPFAATTYGNTVSSSVPMMLAQHLQPQWRKVLLCGFGVGLSCRPVLILWIKSMCCWPLKKSMATKSPMKMSSCVKAFAAHSTTWPHRNESKRFMVDAASPLHHCGDVWQP